MVNFEYKDHYTVADLVELVRILRSPQGCPWDQVQTHASIRRNFIEETLEACEAIDRDDTALLQEELGDVLLQVIFHAGIEEDAGHFTLDDAADTCCKKMIFRHPHVFGTEQFTSLEGQLSQWEALKQQEKGQSSYGDTLEAVARSLPGLWRAEKLQKKAARAGFTWPDVPSALEKLQEEVSELEEAVTQDTNVSEELGDVIFAAAGVAYKAGLDPEECLRSTCEKYIARFRSMESAATAAGTPLDTLSPEEQLALWSAQKAQKP
jgi:tetrapyrrole methylase family protein/MazG family protein